MYFVKLYEDERGFSDVESFKTQKTPKIEIEKAKREIEDYRRRYEK